MINLEIEKLNKEILDEVNKRYYSAESVGDLSGQRFGRLVVLYRNRDLNCKDKRNNKSKCATWKCVCDCGKYSTVKEYNLLDGSQTSCNACKDINRSFKKHGFTETRLYRIYRGMKERCYNCNSFAYDSYGERGISVCKEWREDFLSFYNWAKSNGYTNDLTIDRINTDGDYEPENCRWVNMKVQMNNKRNNRPLTYHGVKHNISEWCKILGVSHKKMVHMLDDLHWSTKKTIDTIINEKNKK